MGNLPTPLVQAIEAWQEEDASTRPFNAVHRLIDAIEVFCKLYTVAGVSQFAEVLGDRIGETEAGSSGQKEQLDRIRAMLAAGLATPSLGIWWGFARETAKALHALEIEHVLPDAYRELTHKKSKLKRAFDGDDNFISFRNSYAHGATPSDQACQDDLAKLAPRFAALLAENPCLAGATLAVAGEDGKWYNAMGPGLSEMEPPPGDYQPGHCYLLTRSETFRPVDLHPLLVYDPSGDKSGNFFFYSDLRSNHASLLNYPLALHRRDKLLREEFLFRFPLDKWKSLSVANLDPFRERIEALTEVFKGRVGELQSLASFLAKKDRGFHVVWGPPGVGKSALLARMVQLLRWDPEIRDQASPGIGWPGLRTEVFEFFIRRGSTDTAAQLFESFNQRLDTRFNLKANRGTTDIERQRHFNERLQAISGLLGEDQRLVLVIDGLDEARGDDPLLGLLPRDVPAKVVVLYGARPQQALRYGFYDELDRERRTCVDLGGLSLEDTRALLYAHVNKYRLQPGYAEAVLARSEGNPLYLKLLCEGLDKGIYTLNESARLPGGMEELYTNALARIEKESPGAAELLALLAAAKDFVSPAMAAELMGLSSISLASGPLTACMELLYENRVSNDGESYQLFHESLREHLREKHGADVQGWEVRLADWASNWQDRDGSPAHEGERLTYAMSYAAHHQADCRKRAVAAGRLPEAHSRGEAILALVEDGKWRDLCFKACGNGIALQGSIRLAQEVARDLDENGSECERMLRFARWLHDEPHRLYNEQRDKLRNRAFSEMEEVAQLAKIGQLQKDRVMLALTAIWATPGRPAKLPDGLCKQIEQWLEDAREPALTKLWKICLRTQ